MVLENRGKIFDTLCQLQDNANVATDNQQGIVSGSAATFDTGGGFTEGKVVFDVNTVQNFLASNIFRLRLRGSKNAAMSTAADLVTLELGDSTQVGTEADVGTGRYIIPFHNDFAGTVYRWLGVFMNYSGTLGTGITYEAYLTK